VTTVAAARPRATTNWLGPAGLLLLAAIPLLAGAIRLVTLAAGVPMTPENARFFASPLPVVLHIVGAGLYLVLGAFQFVPAIRRRAPGWHRRVGRVLVGAGIWRRWPDCG
jgi:Predicted membrane protein (DUF2306)